MRYAMIAALVKDTPQAVGTIDLDNKGFEFETKDKKLTKLLRDVKKKGVFTIVDSSHSKKEVAHKWDWQKINENTVGTLQTYLEENGYYWWEDRS